MNWIALANWAIISQWLNINKLLHKNLSSILILTRDNQNVAQNHVESARRDGAVSSVWRSKDAADSHKHQTQTRRENSHPVKSIEFAVQQQY